jgi:hypothetical protein
VRGTDFALAVRPTQTVLLTGGRDSVVTLTNRSGNTVLVGPLSLAASSSKTSSSSSSFYQPEYIGDTALQILHKIAPELDTDEKKNDECWWFW